MVKGLTILDSELEKQRQRIEQFEAESFFERLRLVGLKTAKEALLRELVANRGEVERDG